ncbi:hypothetical protein FBQ73_11410 [Xanthobacter autotrophicus]|uniref:Uncharacterized protein n=1 Tax=Xanthobacter autotrophicus TaxID=280 RepID=A0A6C1KG57_XANAU|nr:hypothetical protein FBQ73_11410 [Xanthobacter autotrophicus]
MKISGSTNRVMPGLVPGIHAGPLVPSAQGGSRPHRVDGRVKPGHDGVKIPVRSRFQTRSKTHTRSMMVAMPWPTPMHMVHRA